jgi:hypothetical protein
MFFSQIFFVTPLAAGQPAQGVAILVVLAGIAMLMLLIAGFGRLLAATHPAPTPRRVAAVNPLAAQHAPVAAETLAAISAAVVTVLGRRAHVTSVHLEPPPRAPSVEILMGQWSLEGRRQIYSSHKVR